MTDAAPDAARLLDAVLTADGGEELFLAVADAIVPADDHPSATQAGALEFLRRALLVDDVAPLQRLADALAAVRSAARAAGGQFATLDAATRESVLEAAWADPAYRWLEALVVHGYYSDPAGGSNRDGASWRMIDFDPNPRGGWPQLPIRRAGRQREGLIDPAQLLDEYDVVVIGAGAGGGVAAAKLAEAGRSVLLVERGGWPDATELWGDHLRNVRALVGFASLSGPSRHDEPRLASRGGVEREVFPNEAGWSNVAMTVGGGTRVYGAQAWRFTPEDFKMASTYGVPDGSSLADWPLGYAEMEPFYQQAEWEIGVSGDPSGDRSAGPRAKGYPMPPLPITHPGTVLADAAKALGWSTLPVPLLINSVERDGRSGCLRCGACVGFACPVEAKNGSHNTVVERALATGLCSLVLGTRAERIVTDAQGRAVGVSLAGEGAQGIWRRVVRAAEIVVSAGAVESARLLLNSAHDGEPDGMGNGSDHVGRHLQGHLYTGALGIFDDDIADDVGPGPSIATCDFRHGNPGIIGGGNLANHFVPVPLSSYDYLVGAGVMPRRGLGAKQGMRTLRKRSLRVMGPVQEVTSADSRVRVERSVRDRFGLPIARLTGGIHAEDRRAFHHMGERSVEWLEAAGAKQIARFAEPPADFGPSAQTHQAGSCRMGDDPSNSVVDRWGRVWSQPNVRIIDGSTHVTNGGANPVLTILANSFRIAAHMVADC